MGTTSAVPPAFILILGAFAVPFLRGRMLSAYVLTLPLVVFGDLMVMRVEGPALAERWTTNLAGFTLELVRVDASSLLFAYVFTLVAFLGLVFILHTRSRVEFCAALLYAGAALGVVFAGDLLTMFVFWEMLTIGAVFLILARRTKRARNAAMRYLLTHVVGGLILLAGIIVYFGETGSTEFGHIGLGSWATYLIFVGLGVNCAWPLLHAWLTDAYPEATIGGVVFMASFTTKTAVYVLSRTFAGEEVLIWIGGAMATVPIFYAVIENNLRRVLAYSLINQVGFMVVGVGIGTNLALNGTHAHVFSHVLYKALLFMSIGAVMYRTGRDKATDLGGLYKSMPFTAVCCIIGAASISAFPLFSGFVSKSMVMSAAAGENYAAVWLGLLFASAGVFHHAGIKIPFFAFFSHDAGIRVEEAPGNMRLAMGLTAALCVVIGVFPNATLYAILPYEVTYEPYTLAHVIGQLLLLGFSALAFVMLLLSGLYPAESRSTNLDIDVVYRLGARWLNATLARSLNGLNDGVNRTLAVRLPGQLMAFFENGPSRVLSSVAAWTLRLGGCAEGRARAEGRKVGQMAASGAFPVGVPVLLAVTLVLVLYL